ncbi:MAG: bifunctional nicotinamidase/pyrazinamidase [Deltaproteobacteria bacterium]|nr:bifunctional nicotinamidase/pyrazinamidase [Deltaproteobacteria bacterium]
MELKDVRHLDTVQLQKGDALIVVDMQNDFMPGGALAVEKGDAFTAQVNELTALFKEHDLPVVFTQDWHPPDHDSFASQHPGKRAFDAYEAPGIGPVLWPDHAVQGTNGAEFYRGLDTRRAQAVIRKGYHKNKDSYSGFLENDHVTETGLDGYLRGRNVKRVFVCGLAADYCVYFTAVDGAAKGYEVFFLSDLTSPVGSPQDSVKNAVNGMRQKGVRFLKSTGIRR